VLAATVAAPAGAQTGTGGMAPQDVTAAKPVVRAPAPTANLYGSPAPRIKTFSCSASCAPGSLVRVRGKGLKQVDEVLFMGADADPADDTSVAPRKARRKTLTARVPRTAVTGRIAVALTDGTRSPATARPLTVSPAPPALPAGVIDAEAQGHKVFFGGQRPAELAYVVGGTEPAEVKVELIRGSDGAPIATWTPGVVAPGVPQTVEWDGTAAGKVQRDGVYQFRVTAIDSSGVAAQSAQAAPAVDEDSPGAFKLLNYRFPVLGAHSFGEFAAAFGGGRGHQGQDVFAACGTPIVAARGGVVKTKQYHSRAGYYLVIDGDRTGTDFSYMHLREAAIVDQGDKVKTGQLLGFVGDTGRASGCHLHFEEWSAPGWYKGGKPFDPLPDLRAWDAQS
jgi:murein DD-endopeptidase MepM/ murein hydrolase activator NlpD